VSHCLGIGSEASAKRIATSSLPPPSEFSHKKR
jgi:hypothetical protein